MGLLVIPTENNSSPGGALCSDYRFSTTTTMADPGAGNVRVNNATQNLATIAAISTTNDGGDDVSNFLALLDTGDSFYLQTSGDATLFQLYTVTGTPTDNSTWFSIPISSTDSGSNIGNNNKVTVCMAIKGDTGAKGDSPQIMSVLPVYLTASTAEFGVSGETSYARDSTDVYTMEWAGALGLDITSSGVGGLDTGAESADTWYAVYAIGDTTDVNTPDVVASESYSGPTMPAGYDVYRLLFSIRNDDASDFLKWQSGSRGVDKRVFLDIEAGDAILLNSGSATSFAAVSLTTHVPQTSQTVDLLVGFNNKNAGTSDGDAWFMRMKGSSVNTPTFSGAPGIALVGNNGQTSSIEMNTSHDIVKIVTVTLAGTSGTANVTVDTLTKLATFNTSPTITASDFVTSHAAAYAVQDITLTSSGPDLIFTGDDINNIFDTGSTANVSGDLAGTHVVTQESQQIEYKVSDSDDDLALYIQGYTENLI